MKLKLALIILFFTSPVFALFDTANSGQPGEYLYLFSGGARGLSLGLAQTALSGSANNAYSNPAGLADLWWQELSYMYVPLFTGSQFNNVSYGYPLAKNHVIALSLTSLSSSEAEKTNDLGETLGSFYDRQTALTLSYANKITPKLHAGMNVKFVTQEIDAYYQKGVGMDLGLIYCYVPYHYWAINFINLVPPTLGKDSFPLVTKIGFWHSFFSKKLFLTADVAVYNLLGAKSSEPSWFYGLEYSYVDWANFRLGLNNKQFSSGFGIKTRRADFDYAFVYHPLDYIHSFSMNIRFGFLPSEAEIKVKEDMDELSLEKKEYLKRINFEEEKIKAERQKLRLQTKNTMEFNKAWGLYTQEHFELSKTILETILKEDPSFEDAKKLLLEIQTRLDKKIVGIKYLEAKKAYEKGLYSDAQASIDYLLNIKKDHQEAIVLQHLIQARIMLNGQKYMDAKNELMELLRVDPENAEAMQVLKRLQTIIEINK